METDEAVELLAADPARTGIFTDFDGTLSEIVEHPEDAQPVPGAVQLLEELAERFRLVAVVSGRALEDLALRLPARGVLLAGSYGRERSDLAIARRRTEGWETVAAAAINATRTLDGVVVERKGAGLALHYRQAPERADEVAAVAAALAETFELELLPGRLVFELVVPGPGKGDAIAKLVGDHGVHTLLVAGDDVADAEAFRSVRKLEATAVVVAVSSPEAPPDLAAEADLVVPGPWELVGLLQELVRRTG